MTITEPCLERPGGAGDTGNPADPDELGDLGQLYISLAASVQRIVRAAVGAPGAVVEEACQVAWSRLVYYRRRVSRDAVRGWLVTTATREAVRLMRRGNCELSLEAADTIAQLESLLLDPGPSELVEWRDQLGMLSLLSRRQQRVLWMKGLGFSYEEIAQRDGCTRRTVQRQLEHARNALRLAEIPREPDSCPAVCSSGRPLPRAAALAPPPLGR